MPLRYHKMRYINSKTAAIAGAKEALKHNLPADFSMTFMSPNSDEAWLTQWQPISNRQPPNGGWNWAEHRITYNKHLSAMCAALWVRSILSGLFFARLNNTACVIDMIEGSPDVNNPLKGLVIPMSVETCVRYAQDNRRPELWLFDPASHLLVEYYKRLYGFELVVPRKGKPFCRIEV